MANPQKENGYTPIANEILEEIYKRNFNATQLKILLLVLRYTYGFNRKSYEFSLIFISKTINVHKVQVSTELKKLIQANVLTVDSEATFSEARKLQLNKNYEQWNCSHLQTTKKTVDKELTVSENTNPENIDLTVSENANPTVSEFTNPTVSENTNQLNTNIKTTLKQERRASGFTPPTLEEVEAYCKERKSDVDAKKFYDFFSVAEWIDSRGSPVKNWKQKLITWEGGRSNGGNGYPSKQIPLETNPEKYTSNVDEDFINQIMGKKASGNG